MEELAQAIKKAAYLRENSWDKKAYDEAYRKEKEKSTIRNEDGSISFSHFYICTEDFYNMSLEQACDKAAGIVGYDQRGTKPVYLLLKNSWNESLDWANNYDKKPREFGDKLKEGLKKGNK